MNVCLVPIKKNDLFKMTNFVIVCVKFQIVLIRNSSNKSPFTMYDIGVDGWGHRYGLGVDVIGMI